jgi:glutathione S-transferase
MMRLIHTVNRDHIKNSLEARPWRHASPAANRKPPMITLYSMPSSGNSYKARLLMAHLKIPFRVIETEYEGGKELTKQAEFRAKNPHGKVPLLELEDGRLLSESNAILCYLAEGTRFLPENKFEQAKVLQWMFWEQNAHEGSIAVRGAILRYPERAHKRVPEVLDPLLESGNHCLSVMETQLKQTPYLAGGVLTIADICLYGYTHSARNGGFDLDAYPAVVKWLARVAGEPGHVPLEWRPE